MVAHTLAVHVKTIMIEEQLTTDDLKMIAKMAAALELSIISDANMPGIKFVSSKNLVGTLDIVNSIMYESIESEFSELMH